VRNTARERNREWGKQSKRDLLLVRRVWGKSSGGEGEGGGRGTTFLNEGEEKNQEKPTKENLSISRKREKRGKLRGCFLGGGGELEGKQVGKQKRGGRESHYEGKNFKILIKKRVGYNSRERVKRVSKKGNLLGRVLSERKTPPRGGSGKKPQDQKQLVVSREDTVAGNYILQQQEGRLGSAYPEKKGGEKKHRRKEEVVPKKRAI